MMSDRQLPLQEHFLVQEACSLRGHMAMCLCHGEPHTRKGQHFSAHIHWQLSIVSGKGHGSDKGFWFCLKKECSLSKFE